MLGPIVRHLSIVTGLAGSLAAMVPGMLFWPRFSDPYSGSLVRCYLIEMGLIGGTVLTMLLVRATWGTGAVWAACGLTAAFAAAAGITVGSLYFPAGILFGLSGILADLSQPRTLRRHVPIAVAAAAVQLGVMAMVVLRLTGGSD
ncbi:MAG: hypothetical protein ACRD1Q_15780 [Vicinamibacterales bacterium]